IMANLDATVARQWRPLQDTTNDPTMSRRAPKGWASWQRSEDYYNEGLLVWMEVDSILRAKSGGTKSMDDFARAFFGINDGDRGEVTYSFDEVAATLSKILPYDWAGLLRQRLDETGAPAPLAGFAANGYRLVYTDTPTPYFKTAEKQRKRTDLSFSIGLGLGAMGDVNSVAWGSPAFDAGLTVGDTITAVAGQTYTPERLKDAVTAATTEKGPIVLVVRNGDQITEARIDYHGGLRYPRLEKTGSGEGGLDRLLAAK
ncbi:MAG: peptidase M61, partial [Sphingomonas sp.]